MKQLLLGLFLICICSCNSEKDKAYSVIKKHIEDETFSNNKNLKIIDLKITSVDKISIDTLYHYQIIHCKNFIGFYKDWARMDSGIYYSDSILANGYKKI